MIFTPSRKRRRSHEPGARGAVDLPPAPALEPWRHDARRQLAGVEREDAVPAVGDDRVVPTMASCQP
jgi:hypothetical protein